MAPTAVPAFDTSRYLADPSDLAVRLNVPEDDAKLEQALRRASARFNGDAGHPIGLVEDDEHYASSSGGTLIHLPGHPITEVTLVELDGVAVTDYAIGRRTAMLQRRAGWPVGLDNVRVIYSHGHAVIPGDVQDVVLDAAEAAYNMRAAIESLGTGSENVKFSNALAKGGVTELWADTVARYRLDRNGDGE
jgi:hypothetical protein